MPVSGLTVHPDCVTKYNELKSRKLKYIIYRISDDQTEIVVDESGNEDDYEVFMGKVVNKKTKDGKARPSYCVYDVEYELEEGEGKRNKIAFITYIDQDNVPVKPRMVYASSRETLKKALSGIAFDKQCNDSSEIEWAEIKKDASKGRAR